MLRIFAVVLLLLSPMAAQGAYQVNFVSQRAVDRPLDVAAGPDGKMFMTSKNGTVVATGADGRTAPALQEKDAEGNLLLKKPNGIALYGETIYVTDTSRDRVVLFSRNGSYLDHFGSGGSAPKEFSNPRGIAVDHGIIYVADYSNDRVQVFGPNGVYLHSIGNAGEGEQRLHSPTDVAIDRRGLIYAIDADNHLVKLYRQNGDYAGKLEGIGKPRSLAAAEDGIFVSDGENGSIVKFNLDRERLFSFGSIGNGKVQFQEIAGIFADDTGKIYATDTERGTVQVMVADKGQAIGELNAAPPPTSVRWLRDMGLTFRKIFWDRRSQRLYGIDDDKDAVVVVKDGRVEQSLKLDDWRPAAVAVDDKGAVWVVDRGESRIVKFSPDGKVLLTVGSSGSRPGELSRPRAVAMADGNVVYVADTGNDRVQVFDAEGIFRNVIETGTENLRLREPTALAVDRQGNLFVLSEADHVVFCYSREGKFLHRFGDAPGKGKLGAPVDMVLAGHELMLLDADVNAVKVYDLSGTFLRQFGAKGEGKGDFRKPASLAVMDGTHLLVSDYGNKRVQLLGLIYTPPAPQRITATAGMRTVGVTWTADADPPIAKFRVFRTDGSSSEFRELASVTQPGFRDNDVTPHIRYSYRVSAIARDGNETAAQEIVEAVPAPYRAGPPRELRAQSQEWSVDLLWAPGKEKFIDHYNVYREDDEEDAVPELVGQTKTNSFSDGGLEADTSYVYSVAAVSTDNVESNRSEIEATTLVATKPPLEIEVVQMTDIFSNTYKIYENEGIGTLRLANNTLDHIDSLKVSFAIKEFMDFPSEIEIRDLPPRDSKEVPLKAVLNNKVLELTEDTPVQTEITVTYYRNQKARTFSKNHTINIHEKHRMLWIEKDRIATFITSKDPVVLEFTRSVVTQYGYSSPLVHAGAIFDYLGYMGMTYLQHPTNPYQVTAGKTDMIDYVQYPRETLKRNSGVCTDLVVLYSAALESVGVRTLFLGIPGHLFMMFSLGPVSRLGTDTMNGMLVVHDDHVWVPVELTLVGSPFIKAWETGSKAYNDNKTQGIEMTDPAAAWARYKPATLPFSDWRAPVAKRLEVDRRYNGELAKLNKVMLKYANSRHFHSLKQNPRDTNALIQLGIAYGEDGETDEAMEFLERADKLSPNNAMVINNMANLHYLKGQYKKAQQAYEKAAELDPRDADILVNLALCYLRLEQKSRAAEIFQKASSLDPELGSRHRALVLELPGNQ